VAYLFDSDVLSAVLAARPNLAVVRRLAAVPPDEQTTSAVNVAELLFGAIRRNRSGLLERVEALLEVVVVSPATSATFDAYLSWRSRIGSPSVVRRGPNALPFRRVHNLTETLGATQTQ
jgi:predicted nucleic acid-binding protein